MSAVIATTQGTDTSDATTDTLPRPERIIEIVAVILLGLATIGTAWCAFQATQWSGASTNLARQASSQQVENARLFGLATQTVAYDSAFVAQYAEAAAAGNTRLLSFYRSSLMRPEFKPVLDEWEAELNAGQTPTPLIDDGEYIAAQFADYQKGVEAAEQQSRESQVAGDNASGYVGVTILLAVTLFFIGVTTSFKFRPARVLLLAGALATLAFAASRLADLPALL